MRSFVRYPLQDRHFDSIELVPQRAWRRKDWLGGVEGLQIGPAGAEDQLAQIVRQIPTTTDLGIPSLRTKS